MALSELPSGDVPSSDIPSQGDQGICTEQLEDASETIIDAEDEQEQLLDQASPPVAQSEERLGSEPVTVPVSVPEVAPVATP